MILIKISFKDDGQFVCMRLSCMYLLLFISYSHNSNFFEHVHYGPPSNASNTLPASTQILILKLTHITNLKNCCNCQPRSPSKFKGLCSFACVFLDCFMDPNPSLPENSHCYILYACLAGSLVFCLVSTVPRIAYGIIFKSLLDKMIWVSKTSYFALSRSRSLPKLSNISLFSFLQETAISFLI